MNIGNLIFTLPTWHKTLVRKTGKENKKIANTESSLVYNIHPCTLLLYIYYISICIAMFSHICVYACIYVCVYVCICIMAYSTTGLFIVTTGG